MEKKNKTKKVLRIQDLKPKKDAKGGVLPSSAGHGVGHGVGHTPRPHGPHGH